MPHPTPLDERVRELEEREAWRRSLQEATVPEELLGLKPQAEDPRQWPLQNDAAVGAVLEAGYPETFDLLQWRPSPTRNQLSVPACVSFTADHGQGLHQMQEEGRQRVFDALAVHRETGDWNQGRWPDQILKYVRDLGMPEASTGQRFRIEAWAFAPRGPQWEATVKAAIAAGKPVHLCMLLPSNFSWESSGAITQGYHSVLALGYRRDALLVLNSWGGSWGRDGLGWVPLEFLLQSNGQNGYLLANAVTDQRTNPNPDPGPRPDNQPAITMLDPARVKGGQTFFVVGKNLASGGNAFLQWQGRNLPIITRIDTRVTSTAPKVTQTTSGPVRLQIEGLPLDSPMPLTVEVDGDPAPVDDFAAVVFRKQNEARAAAGLQALASHPALVKAAEAHARDMGEKRYFSHIGQDGSNPIHRMERAGLTGWRSWGENIAAGQTEPSANEEEQAGWQVRAIQDGEPLYDEAEQPEIPTALDFFWPVLVGASPEGAFTDWMNSPGHRANILNRAFTHCGVASVAVPGSPYGRYWCVCFAGLSGDTDGDTQPQPTGLTVTAQAWWYRDRHLLAVTVQAPGASGYARVEIVQGGVSRGQAQVAVNRRTSFFVAGLTRGQDLALTATLGTARGEWRGVTP